MASDVTVIQALDCSLCFNILEEPKLLSCTHSFCEKCLQHLHKSQGNGTELLCPLCLHVTLILNKDVSSLKTNVPLKYLIGDVKTTKKICTVCDPETKFPAVYYCQECDEYMCDACLKGHGGFRKYASHVVVSMDDIKSGKVKVKQICHKHPGEERLWVCSSCKVSVCFRCHMIDHTGSDHVVQEVADFKKNMRDKIESLVKRGIVKMERIKSYTNVVQEQTSEVEAIIAEREADINKEFEEKLLQLNVEKTALLDQCKEQKRKLTEKLCQQSATGDELITSLNSACELVGNGVRTLLEGEALVVHYNLCRELQDLLDRGDPEISKLKQVTSQAEGFTFSPCRLDDGHYLGVINTRDWILETIIELNTSKMCPRTMAPTKYGKMLVGYGDSGIKEFTLSGSHKAVLKDVNVWGVSALSDGRYVVRNNHEKISLYSNDWNKLDTEEFETQTREDYGGMDVDKCNNIYVGYCIANTISVFTSEGGAPIRKIPCHGFSPYAVCTMNDNSMLVISNRVTVRVIDQHGTVEHDVTKEGYYARPAVLLDDSVLIGWRKDGLVSIDLYTNQLKHVRTVISGLTCYSPFGALKEFSSGEIAFCNYSKFYVLRKCLISQISE